MADVVEEPLSELSGLSETTDISIQMRSASVPPTLDELLDLPGKLERALQGWEAAQKLYDIGILNYEEKEAIRAGVRGILGLPVDE